MGAAIHPAGTDALSRHGRPAHAWLEWLERNCFLIAVLGACAAGEVSLARGAITPDAWYTLLGGRTVAHGGPPGRDVLAVLTAGRQWVDQQWLGQLGLYGLWRLGGWPLALLGNAFFYVAAFVVLTGVARRLGASDRSTAIVAMLCFLAGLSNTAFRTQVPAYLLFALVLGLLVVDERRPSRRVLLVFPLLVLWANVHGSVVLGAALVALRGVVLALTALRRGSRNVSLLPRALLFILLPWPCVLASPYTTALPGYYHRVLDNPTLKNIVTEWAPTTIQNQPVFFVLLFVGLWFAFRSRGALTPFAMIVLLASAFGGLLAIRDAVWFALVGAVVLPPALDSIWPPDGTLGRRSVNLAITTAGVAALVVSTAATAARPRAWFESAYPHTAAALVARAAATHPRTLVYAEVDRGDWLLFEDPALAGRVAYDIRFEMLSAAQLEAVYDFPHEIGPDWMRAAAGYGLLVLDPAADGGAIRTLRGDGAARLLYTSPTVVVLERTQAGERR